MDWKFVLLLGPFIAVVGIVVVATIAAKEEARGRQYLAIKWHKWATIPLCVLAVATLIANILLG